MKMCPPEQTTAKVRKKPISRSRGTIANVRLMQWLQDEREQRDLSYREIGRRLGHSNGERARAYLTMRIVPGPDIVRRLAVAIGVSPIDALWIAGYQDAVFEYFRSLYRLGWAWMREDQVGLDPSRGASFLLTHWDPEIPEDLSGVPARFADRYHCASFYNEVGTYRTVVLPKPMACAIILATGLFVRRGDVLRASVEDQIRSLSLIASNMLPAAEIAPVPKQIDYQLPFKEIQRILPRGFTDRQTKLALISEYVQDWCNTACLGYAQYARLALYEHGGFVGEPQVTEMYDEDLWRWLTVDPVTIDEFKVKT
jgi:hypothetical protein